MRLEEVSPGRSLVLSPDHPLRTPGRLGGCTESTSTYPPLTYQRGPGVSPHRLLAKRPRSCDSLQPEADTDLPRKRRRLRLGLVTSMLSRPYALPSTHIPARKASSRNGPWTRHKVAGRDLLRKAAIFNKIAMKRRTSGMRGVDHRSLTRKAALIESCPPSMKSVSRSKSPHNRKSSENPAGTESEDLDDYVPFDAFDTNESSEDDDDKAPAFIYSDFNSLRNGECGPDAEVTDNVYSFDCFDTGQVTLAAEAGDRAMSLLRETEKKQEVSFAPALFFMQDRRTA